MPLVSPVRRSAHPSDSPQLKALRWRLLLYTLGVMGFTLAAFALVVYRFTVHSLSQKFDQQLEQLAEAAGHQFTQLATAEQPPSSQPMGEESLSGLPIEFDNDGDLDLPWQNLRRPRQSLEWFDLNGTLLARSGQVFPAMPLQPQQKFINIVPAEAIEIFPHRDSPKVRMLTLPIYIEAGTENQSQIVDISSELQGYVRVSESSHEMEEELERLRDSLFWGSSLALVFAGAGGWWLTQQSLRPVAQSMAQLKQFTADASHELRNPLTAIQASVEVMQLQGDRPADPVKLSAIASATRQMARLVEDLLWLARSDSPDHFARDGTPEASNLFVPIPIEELLEEVVDQYLALAQQRQVELRLQTPTQLVVRGNPDQLRRLFGNLITNALQYSPPGQQVTLATALREDQVQITVRDTGMGMTQEQLPLIFDRFWRADAARSHRGEGSGLGLAIAKAIVEQHQGKIQISSQLHQGSCFQVTFPLA